MAEQSIFGQELHDYPDFLAAHEEVFRRGLVSIDPWEFYASREQVEVRSKAVNSRYGQRKVLCFAQRIDTDDVACVVLTPDDGSRAGDVLIVHDFATAGSEVDAQFSGFWDWFRVAIDDMISSIQDVCVAEGPESQM